MARAALFALVLSPMALAILASASITAPRLSPEISKADVLDAAAYRKCRSEQP